ncbi:hypothetical protein ACJJTC_008746 [Scirpophaga incertulas]
MFGGQPPRFALSTTMGHHALSKAPTRDIQKNDLKILRRGLSHCPEDGIYGRNRRPTPRKPMLANRQSLTDLRSTFQDYTFQNLSCLPFPFGITISLPAFQTHGKTPSWTHRLNNLENSAAAALQTCCEIREVIPSLPGAVLGRFLTISPTIF